MPRYIEEKDIYKLVEPTGKAPIHCSQIDELPRADVVPRSEVEALLKEIGEAISTIYNNASFICHTDMKYGNTDSPNGMIHIGIAQGIKSVANKFAELKKKYNGRTDFERGFNNA